MRGAELNCFRFLFAHGLALKSGPGALEEGLDPELFVRLHRSAIVRKDFITGFTRNPSGRWIARLAFVEQVCLA